MRKSKCLLALTLFTYLFLIGPMVVMIGTAFNGDSALSFPPNGFSLQWFENAFTSKSFLTGSKPPLWCPCLVRCWPCCWASRPHMP